MNITKTYVSKFLIGAVVLMAAFLSSCSNNDYVKNIPNNCTALLSVDAKRVEGVDGSGLLKKILPVEDASISLGKSRLRTETAGLSAVMLARLVKRIED